MWHQQPQAQDTVGQENEQSDTRSSLPVDFALVNSLGPVAARRLFKQRNRQGPLDELALEYAKSGPQPVEDIQFILQDLTNLSMRGGTKRDLAAWKLAYVQLDEVQRQTCLTTLLPLIERNLKRGRKHRKLGRWFFRAMAVSLLLFAAILVLPGSWYYYTDLWDALSGILILTGGLSLLLAPFTGPVSLGIDAWRMARLRPAVTALGYLRSPESVSILARAVANSSLRSAASPALLQALSTVTPDHYGQLSSQTVPDLCKALDYSDMLLTEAILQALSRIGDSRAIKPVQRLGNNGVKLARDILPVLLARQAQENQSAMLLRAASAGQTPAEHLLRPAHDTSPQERPDELLRASQSAEDTFPRNNSEPSGSKS